MSKIKAVVIDHESPTHLAIALVDAPTPAQNEAIVRVAATSLTPYEVRTASTALAGTCPGWDFAGIVEQAAADGSGPKAGTRVVGVIEQGAWAELVAAPSHRMVELPAAVSFAQAATLPIAGLTALYSLYKGGDLAGQRVLITGASGGVGLFAVQLAHQMGAAVIALVRQEQLSAPAREFGADQVVVSADGNGAAASGPYHLIVDGVGGPVLANALTMLAPGGTCVSYGAEGGKMVNFDFTRFYVVGGVSLYGFLIFYELQLKPVAQGLNELVQMVADGRLKPPTALIADWREFGNVARQFIARRFAGKVVIEFST